MSDLKATLRQRGFKTLHVGLFDLDAGLRERRIKAGDLESVFGAGGSFCNVVPQWDVADSVYGPGPFVGEAVGVDDTSLRAYPFEAMTGLLIAEFQGPQADLQPRAVLRRQIEKLTNAGFSASAAFEFEWLVFDESAQSLRDKDFHGLKAWAPDNRCWDATSAAVYADPVKELEGALAAGDISPLGLGMELGAGCLEATLCAQVPLGAADEAALFRIFTKAFFRRRGLSASFMAQVAESAPGLSGHLHLSLKDKAGKPLFFQKGKGASPALEHFIAGVLHHLPAMAVMVLPTVNSYRRLSPGNWAPRTATWSFENYSTAIRAVTTTADLTRLEFRLPGSDVNPHLALAFLLAAGLDGMEKKMTPPPAVEGDGRLNPPKGTPALPRDLLLAADAFEKSKTAKDFFGAAFVERYALSRRHEFDQLRRAVSAAERRRYFEAV